MATTSKSQVTVTVETVPWYDEQASEQYGIKTYRDAGDRIVTITGKQEAVRPFLEAVQGVLTAQGNPLLVKDAHTYGVEDLSTHKPCADCSGCTDPSCGCHGCQGRCAL